MSDESPTPTLAQKLNEFANLSIFLLPENNDLRECLLEAAAALDALQQEPIAWRVLGADDQWVYFEDKPWWEVEELVALYDRALPLGEPVPTSPSPLIEQMTKVFAPDFARTSEPSYVEFRSSRCHAGSDGDCSWKDCPQLRDGEPRASGRHCPLASEPSAESKCPRCQVSNWHGDHCLHCGFNRLSEPAAVPDVPPRPGYELLTDEVRAILTRDPFDVPREPEEPKL